MSIFSKYLLKKDVLLRKKIEIDNSLYEKLGELSNVYDASCNKLINIAIVELIHSENVNVYKKPVNEISVSHNLLIRSTAYYALESLREKYGISIYRLVNIAIKNAINEEK